MNFIKRIANAALFGLLICVGLAHAGTVTYVYTDPQGTPLAEANASGTITATFDYKPYGSQALGSSKAGPGYTGHVNDPDTGFVYMQARYYDSVAGRFLAVDPIGPFPNALMSFNRYQYANNNPININDSTGMCGEVSDGVQRMRNLSDVSSGGFVQCFLPSEGQTDFGTVIGSIPGYPESGKNSWRASNDMVYIMASVRYSSIHNSVAGGAGNLTAKEIKAWSMVESGGSKRAFLSDPLQVNNPGDWDSAKATSLGLARNEKMNPMMSASAAAEWWRTKGFIHDRAGRELSWRGGQGAFERYNGNTRRDRTISGQPVEHAVWYANQVLRLSGGN